jgi:type II secretory pathway pseudopilin PulG
MPISYHTIKSMTLIEVLITIVVFSVGILTILSIITNSLSLGSRSRNRTTATMLAKEWLEMMYNIRDTNLDKAQNRWCIPIPSDPCNINIGSDGTYIFMIEWSWSDGIILTNITNNPDFSQRRLYISTWSTNYYTHNNSFPTSSFYRYITISNSSNLWAD